MYWLVLRVEIRCAKFMGYPAQLSAVHRFFSLENFSPFSGIPTV
jgi:hypothetical protein